MNAHLGDEGLIGYIHYTLTDADRETMDDHLSACTECRTRLAELEVLHRRIRYCLSADIRAVSPPRSMTFAAIAPRLEHRRWWDRLQTPSGQLLPGATALAALTGLAVALVSLFYSLRWGDADPAPMSANRLPVVACGCFAVAVMGNYRWRAAWPPRLVLMALLSLALWIGTAIVGLQVIVTVLDMFTWLLYLGVSREIAGLGAWILVPVSVVWIAIVVGGGEYHFKHIGQPGSWRLFGFTVAIELLVLGLPYLLGIWFSVPPVWR